MIQLIMYDDGEEEEEAGGGGGICESGSCINSVISLRFKVKVCDFDMTY